MHHYAQLCLTQGVMERRQKVAREDTEFWKSKATAPIPKTDGLLTQLETCLADNATMEQGWNRDRKLLEETVKQRDHYLKLSNVRGDSLKKLEDELEQMERAQEQRDLQIQALDTALGEVKEERDRYKQKWEQLLTPTTAESPATTTTAPLSEAASIVPHDTATPIAKKVKVKKAKATVDDGSLSLGEFAARLGVTKGAISGAKGKGEESLTKLCVKHDPGGIVWTYDEEAMRYYPIS